MNLDARRPTQPRLLQRFVALALALLFVVQSAAQSADGCWKAALGAGCCCASRVASASETKSEATSATPHRVRSCCATEPSASESSLTHSVTQSNTQATTEKKTQTNQPRATHSKTCGCKLAPLPSAPAQVPTTSQASERADERGAFADWIAAAAPLELAFVDVVATSTASPPTPPPPDRGRPTATSLASRRLASRGITGHLSGLCTLRT